MPLKTEGLDALMNDIRRMAQQLDLDGEGGAVANKALKNAAVPIYDDMRARASSDPKIITKDLYDSIKTSNVRKRKSSGRTISIGISYKEKGAYYANPVEFGHGGPAPAPAHPFVRPAYDTHADEAYNIIRDNLRDAIDNM